jgi:hypothetical protein
MKSTSNHLSHESIVEMLEQIGRKGVKLWSQDGQLRYKAPKGALSPAELQRLGASGDKIVAFLQKTTRQAGPLKLMPRREYELAPITFSQLAHWQMHGLSQRPCVRQIASATRLTGMLDVKTLRAALAEIVARHEALRTRIITVEGVLMQHVSATGSCELQVEDLSIVPADQQHAETQRHLDEMIMVPVYLDTGPLTGVRLLKLGGQEHVVLIAMEHAISDAASMSILVRDLLRAYGQMIAGGPLSLPPVPIQFADYATWQRESHPYWIEKHGSYWDDRLRGSERMRFPRRHASGARPGWGSVPVRIEADVKQQLKRWCRQRHTTLVLAVFTAYVAAAMRWCAVTDAVFRFQIDGRSDPKLEYTVGYLASALHLRFELSENDTFLDLLDKVTREYCSAYEHSDASYLETRKPQPSYASNCRFNWVPCETTAGDSGLSDSALTATAYPHTNPVLERFEVDSEPSMLLYDSDGAASGAINFPRDQFSPVDIEMFVREFETVIDRLLNAPEMCIARGQSYRARLARPPQKFDLGL